MNARLTSGRGGAFLRNQLLYSRKGRKRKKGMEKGEKTDSTRAGRGGGSKGKDRPGSK
jgi:hypothetical protein